MHEAPTGSEMDRLADYSSFAAAARASLDHLHAVMPLDLWLVTYVDLDAQSEPVAAPLLERLGVEESTQDRQVVVSAVGPLSRSVPAGATLPWSTSYCRLMLSGDGPSTAADTRRVAVYEALEPAVAAYGFGTVRAYVGRPLTWADGTVFGTVCGYHLSVIEDPTPPHLGPGASSWLDQLDFVATILSQVLAAEQYALTRAHEARQALVLAEADPLTGLRNRRGWNVTVAREQERVARYGHSASVVVIDLDGLEKVTHSRGPAEGEALVTSLANVLLTVCRPADVLARTGDGKFAVLAIQADPHAGSALATRIRARLARAGIAASVGVATRRVGEDLNETAGRAEATIDRLKGHRRTPRGGGPRT